MQTKLEQINSVYARLMGFAQAIRDLETFDRQMPQAKIIALLIEYVNEYEKIVGAKNETAN